MEFMCKSAKCVDKPANDVEMTKRLLANLIEITTLINGIEMMLFGNAQAVVEVDSISVTECVNSRLNVAIVETNQIIKQLTQLRDKLSLL